MRLLQVGLGNWGRNWASTVVPEVSEVEPVGYVDVDEEALQAAAEAELPAGGSYFTSVEDGIAATNPDAVLVTASLPGHVPAAQAALRSGRPVLVEKPFAPTMEEARSLVDLARDRDLVLMVSQNYRFFPAVRAVQSVVASGELGRLNTINLDFRKGRPRGDAPRPQPGRSRRRPPLAEPLLSDMSIHHFDLVRAVTGDDVAEIDCRTWLPEGYGFAGPPAGAALITLAGGTVVSYRGSWVSPGPGTAWAGEWRMEFERGELAWTSRGDGPGQTSQDRAVIRAGADDERELPLPPVTRVDRAGSLTEFHAAVREGRQPESSGRDNLGSIAVTYAAIESAKRRAPVAVDAGR